MMTSTVKHGGFRLLLIFLLEIGRDGASNHDGWSCWYPGFPLPLLHAGHDDHCGRTPQAPLMGLVV